MVSQLRICFISFPKFSLNLDEVTLFHSKIPSSGVRGDKTRVKKQWRWTQTQLTNTTV